MASIYRYPLKAFTDTTDYLQIDVVRYKTIKEVRGDQGQKSIASKARSRSVNQGLERIETVLLPIPSNVSDSNGVKYGESELNNIAGAAIGGIGAIMETGAAYAKGNISGGLQTSYDTIKNTLGELGSSAGGISGLQGFVTRKLTASAAGILGANITPSQILARTQGEILNPNIELLFGGPTLRSFRFQYKMMPRNRDEGEQIKQIIRCFKRHMASKLGSGNTEDTENTFLRTPDVFELRYRQGAGEHKYLHKFKQCFLESINVNYTGEGVYSTYEDGTPVSMIMDLTFKEIEPVYDLDQQEAGGVGY